MRPIQYAMTCLILILIISACDNSGGGGGGSGDSSNGSPANTAPVAVNDLASTTMNSATNIDVLVNDTDADGDALTITSFAQPSYGAVSLAGSQLSYLPAAGYSGNDSFTYTISDGKGGSDSATVTIDVQWTNTAPIAQNDSASTPVNLSTDIDVLSNDSDADGDTLTVTSVASPANGTATMLSNGQVRYTPSSAFAGSDSFTYTCADGKGGSDTGTVNVNVWVPAWTAASSSTVGSDNGAHSVVIADLNNDGDLDLAFANARAGTRTVHLNTSTGGALSFATPTSYTSSLDTDIKAVDVNGDGLLDLLSPAFLAGDLRVRINDAANPGSFLAEQAFAASYSGLDVPWDIATGDIDGDGDIDVVMAHMNDRQITVMENYTTKGSTTAAFGLVGAYASGIGNPMGVALADFNADGLPDLVSSTPDNSGEVWVRMNTGSMTFSAATIYSAGGGANSVTCGDVDGDGKPDIVVANASNSTLGVLINQTANGATSPSFAAAVSVSASTATNSTVPQDVILVDLTGDGRLDIVTSGQSGTVSVWLNYSAPGTLSLTGPTFFTTSASAGYHVAAGDLNGDGVADIAITDDNFPSSNVVLIGQ